MEEEAPLPPSSRPFRRGIIGRVGCFRCSGVTSLLSTGKLVYNDGDRMGGKSRGGLTIAVEKSGFQAKPAFLLPHHENPERASGRGSVVDNCIFQLAVYIVTPLSAPLHCSVSWVGDSCQWRGRLENQTSDRQIFKRPTQRNLLDRRWRRRRRGRLPQDPRQAARASPGSASHHPPLQRQLPVGRQQGHRLYLPPPPSYPFI